MEFENYVYKKVVDWSVLMEGFTLPIDNQVIFIQNMGRFLQRGESKLIHFYMDGVTYDAKIVNINNPVDKRKKDAYQIRYTRNGDFSQALQAIFNKSYLYIQKMRQNREKGNRQIIKLPEEMKEYLAIYTTEYEDTFLIEPIISDDIHVLRKMVSNKTERSFEAEFDYEIKDEKSGLTAQLHIVKVRKLNRKIGENLKLLYGYRCQICGRLIGAEYGSHIAESHHIDYFVKSLNNDANNQMILCPNHHSIIHDANPVFDRSALTYIYDNGYKEKLVLNKHLTGGYHG